MRNLITILFIFASILLPGASQAQERQYRHIKLIDGRELKAEILQTVSLGLEVNLPQGKALIRFDLLVDMVPIERTDFEAEDPAYVWVRAPGNEEVVHEAYRQIPKLKMADEAYLGRKTFADMNACGADFECMSRVVDGRKWLWIVVATPPTDDRDAAIVFRSRTNYGDYVEVHEAAKANPEDVKPAALKAIGLIPDQEPPRQRLWGSSDVGKPPRGNPSVTIARDRGTALVPVPGYAFLRQGRPGAFAASLIGSVAASSGTAIFLMTNDVDPKIAGSISGIGFYGLCLATNGIAGKSRKRFTAVSALPRQSGAAVSFSGRF